MFLFKWIMKNSAVWLTLALPTPDIGRSTLNQFSHQYAFATRSQQTQHEDKGIFSRVWHIFLPIAFQELYVDFTMERVTSIADKCIQTIG